MLYENGMNFLSHAVVLGAETRSLAYVGAALPDLWPHMSARPLPKLVLDRLRVGDDPDRHALAHGIAHHMQADAAFHRHPSFLERVSVAAARIEGYLAEPRWSALVAHVLVEMLLDRWLIEGEAGLVDRYYGHFVAPTRARAAELASAGDAARGELAGMLERFVSLRFLADYLDFERLVWRLSRALGRADHAILAEDRLDALAIEARRLHRELAPGSGELLDDVRRAVDAKLPPLAAPRTERWAAR